MGWSYCKNRWKSEFTVQCVLTVQVVKDGGTYSETPVEISGDENAIKKAREIIEELINPTSTITNQMGGVL